MPNASSTFTDAIIKSETTYGVLPGASGAQYMRRTALTLDLKKETYESNEQRPDSQVADMRHGARQVVGKYSGELSPATYAEFIANILRRDWASPGDITGLTLTIASASGNYTITRSAGDFLSNSGMNVGSVWRINAGAVNSSNLNKRLLVLNATSTVLTVTPINGSTLVPEGPISGCTLNFPGKRNYMPASTPTPKSMTVEKWFTDVAQSEVYTGIKVKQAAFKIPSTGLAMVDFDLEGQDVTTGTSRYFTSPSAATSTPLLAAVNGVVRAAGVIVGNVTGVEFNITAGLKAESVVGSNTRAEPFNGRLRASGQFTALFNNATLRDAFIAESEVELIFVLTGDNSGNTPFMAFAMTRVKLGAADKSDATDAGVVQTFPFTALLQINGGAGTKYENTTIMIQDSNVP